MALLEEAKQCFLPPAYKAYLGISADMYKDFF